jgi:hypothetical protein
MFVRDFYFAQNFDLGRRALADSPRLLRVAHRSHRCGWRREDAAVGSRSDAVAPVSSSRSLALTWTRPRRVFALSEAPICARSSRSPALRWH